MNKVKLGTKALITEKKCILVLGMHRSGTSALSGVFHQLGAGISENSMGGSTNNPKGYFEAPAVRDINDEILASFDSTWNDWATINKSWLSSIKAMEFQKKAEDIIVQEFDISRLFILKDPRICRLTPFWINVLNNLSITPMFVHTHRNPLEVAASLHRRNFFQPSAAFLLWLRHILDAEASTRGELRYFTSYKNLLQDWNKQIIRMQDVLGTLFPKTPATASDDISAFLNRDLQHHDEVYEEVINNLALSEWIRTTFRIIESWANTGEDSKDYSELDRIKTALDTAAPTFVELTEYEKKIERTSSDLERATLVQRETELVLENKKLSLTLAEKTLVQQKSDSKKISKELTKVRYAYKKEQKILAETVKDHEVNIQSLTTNLHEQSQELSNAKEKIISLEICLQDKIREAEIIKDHEVNIQSLTTNLHEQTQELSNAKEKIISLEISLQDRFRELAALPEILLVEEKTRRDIEISQINKNHRDIIFQHIAEKKQQALEITQINKNHSDTVARLMDEKKQQGVEIAELHKNHNDAISRLMDDYNSIINSNSWKITVPLRLILDRVHSFKKK